MAKRVGVELGACVEMRGDNTPGFICGIVTKELENGKVVVSTPAKKYECRAIDCRPLNYIPTKLEKFAARKRKELGLKQVTEC